MSNLIVLDLDKLGKRLSKAGYEDGHGNYEPLIDTGVLLRWVKRNSKPLPKRKVFKEFHFDNWNDCLDEIEELSKK